MSKTPTQAMPDDEPGNTNIDNMAALECGDDAGLVMTGRGVARCSAALAGMAAITNILFQLDLDKECTGGTQAKTTTTTGLIQALAVCAEFVRDHIGGGGFTPLHAQVVQRNSPLYAELHAIHSKARREV